MVKFNGAHVFLCKVYFRKSYKMFPAFTSNCTDLPLSMHKWEHRRGKEGICAKWEKDKNRKGTAWLLSRTNLRQADSPRFRANRRTNQQATETGDGYEVSVCLTFRRNSVFMWASRQTSMVGIQPSHMACAITTRRWASTLFLLRPWGIYTCMQQGSVRCKTLLQVISKNTSYKVLPLQT